jgi:DNA-directed RNA polymerase subunit RPC12/RpoP
MTYTEAQVSEAMELLPTLWILKHKIKNESGDLLEFSKRKFQWDMYNDLSPKQVTLKPPQIGETVKNLVKSFYVAKKLNKDIIYTLPTDSDIRDMAGGKINRIIAQNPILQQWIKEHDSVEQKQVGHNIIYYRGTFTQNAAMMVSSSLNMHDEVDASDASVITQYETRLEGQEDESKKWRWYFSHPSLSGHGVDVYWQQSDKKEWHVRCPHCAKEQSMQWPDNIDMEKQIYICSTCKKELPDEARINGRWINQDGVPWDGSIVGDYLFSGWHVSQLMLYNKKAKDIIAAYNDPQKDKQYFYNYVLGLPFIGSDDKIEPSVVLKNCVDVVNPQEGRTVIGVDTGHGVHFVLMNKDGLFYYENATEITASKTPYDRLESMLKRFPRSIIVSDQGGDLIGIRQLQAKYPGRVFLCFYNKDRKTVDIVEWGENEEYGKVRVDRNRMMTLMVEQLRDIGRVRLCGTKEEWAEYAEQFGTLYREQVVVRDTQGKDNSSLYGSQYVWKRNGPDHFAHATLYAMVGMQRFGGEPAKIIGNDPLRGLQRGQIVEAEDVVSYVSAADFKDRAPL